MAAPSYTEDLTDIATGDESSGWSVFSTNQQGSPTYQDGDYPYIQGSYAVCQTCSKGSKTVANLGYDYGSDTAPGTDEAIFVWQNFSTPTAIDDYAGATTGQAGMCILIGNSTSNFDIWEVGGSDVPPYPYGGWTCHAVCPEVTADDVSNGPRTSEQVIGAQVNLIAFPAKGEPHAVDVMRFGRGSSIFQDGDISNGYCTFAGFAAVNDATTARWGLLQKTSGGYLWQGRMLLGNNGTGGNAVDFRDSNATVFIKYTPKVTANFNLIEIQNNNGDTVTSYVEWDGVTFTCLDPVNTASKGRLLMTDDADVTIYNCTFNDMDTFVFSKSTNTVNITGTTFNRCGQITQGGAQFIECIFNESTAAIALVVDVIAAVLGCTFVSDGDSHAVDLGTISTSATITWSNSLIGYAAGVTGDPITENDTTNAAILVNVAASQKLTINVAAGATVPSVKNTGTGTVAVVSNFTHTIEGLELGTEVTYVTAGTSTELFHVESASVSDGNGKYKTDYVHSGGATVDILIHHVNYQPDISNIYGLTLPSGDATVKVQMFYDDNYLNP